jgi:trigger factor
VERARQYPGQEKAVWEFYRKNPQALAEIRAPLFEEKVVDHLLAQTAITDKAVTREELMREDGQEDGASGETESAPAAKKPRAKKKAADAAGA